MSELCLVLVRRIQFNTFRLVLRSRIFPTTGIQIKDENDKLTPDPAETTQPIRVSQTMPKPCLLSPVWAEEWIGCMHYPDINQEAGVLSKTT